MIEIIKLGEDRYKWICAHCGCEFTALEEDEKFEEVLDNHGICWGSERTIKCPHCRELLSNTMLPKSKRIKIV